MTLGRQNASELLLCSGCRVAVNSLHECACFGAGRCLLSAMCPLQGKEEVPLSPDLAIFNGRGWCPSNEL